MAQQDDATHDPSEARPSAIGDGEPEDAHRPSTDPVDGQAGEPDGPRTARQPEPDGGWELWAKVSLLMGALGVGSWGLVFLRLGEVSIYTHAFVVPALGAMTLVVTFWGLVKTLFNRPLFRWSRTVGFGVLLTVGFFGSVPIFSVPLSTEDFESSHVYRLPFDGRWAVTAGGDSTATNYHAATPVYRWAYDFTPVRDGRRYTGDGRQLSDYYCYGKPVLAPVGGEVVKAVADQDDSQINQASSTSVMGNHVVIRVDQAEYLFISQMKKDSVTVGQGDQVGRGQKVGECGNSGRSMKPNVHVHLQNSTDFPVAESLPLRFSDYLADGHPVDKGMPRGSSDSEHPVGEYVENQPQKADPAEGR